MSCIYEAAGLKCGYCLAGELYADAFRNHGDRLMRRRGTHGKSNTYDEGCRCQQCLIANRRRHQRARALNQERISFMRAARELGVDSGA